ncbi:hypothetical protein GGR57DRAFT_498598 [Xylariaceae sp. FL1272]|nr:hypothetical protein GGR57DRAFT_498598 [Xylariaceae sp. FL1272]
MPLVAVGRYAVLLFSREEFVKGRDMIELDVTMLEPVVKPPEVNGDVEMLTGTLVSDGENDSEVLLFKTPVEVSIMELVELTPGLDITDATVEPSIVMLLCVRELGATVEVVKGIITEPEDVTRPDVRLFGTRDVGLLINEAVSVGFDDILVTLPIVDDALGVVEVALAVALGDEYGLVDEATIELLLMFGVTIDETTVGALVERDNGYGPELELVGTTGLMALDAKLDWLSIREVIVKIVLNDPFIGGSAVVKVVNWGTEEASDPDEIVCESDAGVVELLAIEAPFVSVPGGTLLRPEELPSETEVVGVMGMLLIPVPDSEPGALEVVDELFMGAVDATVDATLDGLIWVTELASVDAVLDDEIRVKELLKVCVPGTEDSEGKEAVVEAKIGVETVVNTMPDIEVAGVPDDGLTLSLDPGISLPLRVFVNVDKLDISGYVRVRSNTKNDLRNSNENCQFNRWFTEGPDKLHETGAPVVLGVASGVVPKPDENPLVELRAEAVLTVDSVPKIELVSDPAGVDVLLSIDTKLEETPEDVGNDSVNDPNDDPDGNVAVCNREEETALLSEAVGTNEFVVDKLIDSLATVDEVVPEPLNVTGSTDDM